jgi:type VI secretion system secreted protein Hcp
MDVLILDCGAIKGESTLTDYKDMIEVLSFSHGVAQQITGDQSNQVVLTVGQNENGTVSPFMKYTLTNALISSVSVGGGGGGKPQETVTFNYTAIKWEYKLQAAAVSDSGNNSATWNLGTNTAT